MSRKKKITLLVTVVVIAALLLCSVGIALTVNDGIYNKNTPMYISVNSTVTGEIEDAEDYEAYMFGVSTEGILSIDLEHDNAVGGLDGGYTVTLYKMTQGEDSSYYEIASFDSFWSEVFTSSGEMGIGKGTYCIAVTATSEYAYGDFTLTTYFTQSSAFESEPNDSQESADMLTEGLQQYGSVSQRSDTDDCDWYSITLSEDKALTLSFMHEDKSLPGVGWNIKVFTADGELLTEFTSKLSDTVVETGSIGLRAGNYYVKVEGQSVTYQYSLVYKTSSAANHEIELNDSVDTATELPCNTSIKGTLSERLLGLDKDYYKITLTENGYIDLTFNHAALTDDKNGWNIRVLKEDTDGSYYEIVKKISPWNVADLKIEGLGLAAGEYFVVIDADSLAYSAEAYTVRWTFTASENYEREPNSIIRHAGSIDFNEYYYGAIISSDVSFDEDYYKFKLTQKSNVSLELGHKKVYDSAISWTVSIVDDDGLTVTTVESSLNEGLVSTGVITLPAGTYYVKIETGLYGSEAQYYFRLVR